MMLGCVLLLSSSCSTLFAEEVKLVDFGREIRPILSNHCFQCHGSDEGTREADMRLDLREAAIEAGAINLDELSESELLQRIKSHDDSTKMPPAEVNKPLTPQQISTLELWIKQGAEYGDHWAFERIEKPAIPETSEDTWCRNEIDAFILRKLQSANLKHSPEANRETLIRRLYQDLLGLLPDPTEVTAFVNDKSPQAYQKLVDRLLASPHYGERWGRHWLDQARYADSHGHTIDGPRVMWPYRDWVINAINDDMPFDQFTIEQIAGDLLPNATKSQQVATAFHRNTMINQEGGVKPDEYRNEALIDRTNTTGAVWLGLTVGCTQCHSHKFDPISHDEYYSLYAFFNDAADSNNTGPTVDVYEEEMFGWSDEQNQQLAELKKLQKSIVDLEKQTKDETGLEKVEWDWVKPQLVKHETESGVPLSLLDEGSFLVKEKPAPNETFKVTLGPPDSKGNGENNITAIRLRVLPHDTLPSNGPGYASNGNFVLTDFSIFVDGEAQPLDRAWADHSQPKFDVSGAIDNDVKSGWAINVDSAQAKAGKKMNAPHEAVFTFLKPVNLQDAAIEVVMKHASNSNYLVGHFAFDVTSTPVPGAEDQSELKAELAAAKKQAAKLESLLPGQGKPVKQMVIKQQTKIPATYRLVRGDFLDPDEEGGALSPTVPASLITGQEKPEFKSRLDLAHWLVSRDNPLTARVTVNRVWAKYFGRGLVETENDFGFQGTQPTHPELLDWLSVSLMENEWSMKELHRLIVSSATYRQTSDFRTEYTEKDPGNYLLARQSRFRVEAEIVRDQALSASGLLTPDLGGPSVYPPQPDGVYNFTQSKKSWPTETGADRYRRTMYTMFYRSAPYPLLSTFDTPDFSTTCTRRVRSNTPLQSLTMANDVVFQEFAAGLAKRVANDASIKSLNDQLRQLFRFTLTRTPNPDELDVLSHFYHRELERFQATPKSAEEYVQTEAEGTDRLQLAALTSLARVLLNTDEFMTRN